MNNEQENRPSRLQLSIYKAAEAKGNPISMQEAGEIAREQLKEMKRLQAIEKMVINYAYETAMQAVKFGVGPESRAREN